MATTEFPTTFTPELQIITPDMGLGEEIDATLHNLRERGFVVGYGLTERLAGSLALTANEPHILEFCPTQPERFGDEALAKKWQSKGRMMGTINHVIGHKNEPLSMADLRAVTEEDLEDDAHSWAGLLANEHIPEADVTTAYRVVKRGLHQGLARPLVTVTVGLTTALHDIAPERISLESWVSNTYANRVYDADFVERALQKDMRPTRQKVGSVINGNLVYLGVNKKGEPTPMVEDTRRFMQKAA